MQNAKIIHDNVATAAVLITFDARVETAIVARVETAIAMLATARRFVNARNRQIDAKTDVGRIINNGITSLTTVVERDTISEKRLTNILAAVAADLRRIVKGASAFADYEKRFTAVRAANVIKANDAVPAEVRENFTSLRDAFAAYKKHMAKHDPDFAAEEAAAKEKSAEEAAADENERTREDRVAAEIAAERERALLTKLRGDGVKTRAALVKTLLDARFTVDVTAMTVTADVVARLSGFLTETAEAASGLRITRFPDVGRPTSGRRPAGHDEPNYCVFHDQTLLAVYVPNEPPDVETLIRRVGHANGTVFVDILSEAEKVGLVRRDPYLTAPGVSKTRFYWIMPIRQYKPIRQARVVDFDFPWKSGAA